MSIRQDGSDVHTVPNPDGPGYVNKVEGKVVTVPVPTQKEAAEQGRAIAQQNQSEHVIHSPSGQIVGKNSQGNDPFPPRDKR
ncbi:DUF2188 domain-containing protein [Corallococcus exiguus]|uniref:DUF2188 domain-containing protein n=1 Tax=Corallococcus exiguus TaxID=83462 RepID=UPI001474A3A5|nr:DUF2188 domain-containing protein [Corallococcus exiguus]